jgi:hypothetical protein
MTNDPMAGMRAAIECCRIQYTGMAQASRQAGDRRVRTQAIARAAVLSTRKEAEAAGADLDGSLIGITLRAAQLACHTSTAAGQPMTIPEFLDDLEDELTPPDSPGDLRDRTGH